MRYSTRVCCSKFGAPTKFVPVVATVGFAATCLDVRNVYRVFGCITVLMQLLELLALGCCAPSSGPRGCSWSRWLRQCPILWPAVIGGGKWAMWPAQPSRPSERCLSALVLTAALGLWPRGPERAATSVRGLCGGEPRYVVVVTKPAAPSSGWPSSPLVDDSGRGCHLRFVGLAALPTATTVLQFAPEVAPGLVSGPRL